MFQGTVIPCSLQRVADSMPVVQNRPKSNLPFVFRSQQRA